MFKIGEFSSLTRVSVKALRHYDALGLLRPARVDRDTGYRYYSAAQLPRLNRILALKDLGFSLEQIGAVLENALSVDELRGMFRLKEAEIRQVLSAEQARLARLEARLRYFEKEETMSNYDVVLKSVDPVRVASIRAVIPNYPAIGQLYEELCPWLQAQQVAFAGPAIAIYYDEEYKEQDVNVEAAVPVADAIPAHERIALHDLPAIPEAATVIHTGPYEGLMGAYQALMGWIEANGYRIVGPTREVYLVCQDASGTDASQYVTEIQAPVARV